MLFALGGFGAEVTIRVLAPDYDRVKAEAFVDNTYDSYPNNEAGFILIGGLDKGPHAVTIFIEGYASKTIEVNIERQLFYEVEMKPLESTLETVEVSESSNSGTGHGYLKYIQVDGLYAAKKNEVIVPGEMSINQANNNGRQIFAKVPGVNVQETDAGGLQMGVGARGLDPKRTTNFNTRQDGYDIAADALGYPESYYTPAIEAVQQIELVRGAASLQYGTQFG
ncbi:MAG TPA: TonB-dependent receptor, partial [Flavobacteriales bacterium]|nr:TonB-dependent receptor [Flavobacteriales bacterium]